MTRFAAIFLSAALLCGLCACAPATNDITQTTPAPLKAVAYDDYEARFKIHEENPLDSDYIAALQDFSVRLAPETLSSQDANMCVSPVSLFMALSMVTQGAGSDTRDELLTALGLSSDTAKNLAKQSGNLMRQLHTDNETGLLKLANSVWAQNGMPFEQNYLDSMSNDFYASVFSADFADKSTGDKAGQWIADHTGGLLTPAISFESDTLMALINTVYLNDQWVDQFHENGTKPDTFHKADGTEVTCDFMNREALTGTYVRGNGFTAAPLGLKNSGQMIFILPDEGVSIDELLADTETVAAMLDTSGASSGKVIYKIPKFSFGAAPEVMGAVRALGVNRAFAPDADFTGILNDPLFISSILQETYIEIDEQGMQAAAYTMIMMAPGAAMPEETEPVMLVLDRPFLFAIVSNTGAPLFMGVVNDPLAK